MEAHHISRGGSSDECPGDRNGIQQLSRNRAMLPYPQYSFASAAPPALGGMVPAPVDSGEHPASNDGGFAGFNSSPSIGSHYRAFLEHHRTFGRVNGPALGFSRTEPAPSPCDDEPPGPIQNV